MSKIGLYGGSFDPVHQGHVQLALKVLDDLKLDEIWFVLAYDQPLKQEHFESFENRLLILEETIKEYPKLKVCTIEKDLDKPSYTYNTVKELNRLYPKHEFSWIIGADNLETLSQWYRIEDLKSMIQFIVVNRGSNQSNKNMIDFNHEASSSKIRNGDLRYLDEDIINLLFEKKLYIETILYNVLSKKRADHVIRCTEVAEEIAACYDINQTDVYKAVVLHDIAKELNETCEQEIMDKYFSEHKHYHPKVYHQFTGSYIAYKYFKIKDKKVLDAIKYHTTGDSDDLLAMVTFVADKVERGRSYPVEGYIELAKKNIQEAFQIIKEDGNKAREKKKGEKA